MKENIDKVISPNKGQFTRNAPTPNTATAPIKMLLELN